MTLNPDRSGKMELDISIDFGVIGSVLELLGEEKPVLDPDDATLPGGLARMMMELMKGFEAWAYSDFTVKDNVMRFKITGYFPDCNKIELNPKRVGLPDAYKNGGITSTTSPQGQWTVTLGQTPPARPDQPAPSPSSVEKVQTRSQADKAQLGMILLQAMLDEFLKKQLKEEWSVRMEVVVGGTVVKTEGALAKVTENKAAFEINAPRMWALAKDMIGDREFISAMFDEAAGQRRAVGNVDPAAYSTAFRQLHDQLMRKHGMPELDSPQRLELRAGSPAFDYAEEVKQARKPENAGRPISLCRSLPQDGAHLPTSPLPMQPVPTLPGPKVALGIHLGDPTSGGLGIVRVIPTSPAEKAGLLPNDVLLKVRGVTVETADDYAALLTDVQVGQAVKVQVLRLKSGQLLSLEVPAGDRAVLRSD